MQAFRKNESVCRFMQDVADQIQYKPIVHELCDELYQHIEDRQEEYLEQGVEPEQAVKMALCDMGNPAEIGVRLNETHRLETPSFVLLGILSLVAAGGICYVLYLFRKGYYMEDTWLTMFPHLYYSCRHILVGIALLLLFFYYGYPWLVKYSGRICKGYLLFSLCAMIYSLLYRRLIYIWPDSFISYRVSGPMVDILALMLAVPVLTVYIYKIRNRWKYSHLIGIAMYTILAFGGAYESRWFTGFTYKVIFLMVMMIVLLFMAYKHYFAGSRSRNMAITALLCLAVAGVWGNSEKDSVQYFIKQCFEPESVAAGHFTDAYNSLKIKELLSKARLVGGVELSEQQMTAYYDDSWYYDGVERVDFDRWGKSIPGRPLILEDILPQHYYNNYMIAHLALSYGWLPAILLLGLFAGICFCLLRLALKIRNPMGQLAALASALCIVLQVVLYVAGNFGCQFGYFCALPYLAGGDVNHIMNMLLTGILFSAYRYDKVMKEPDRYQIYEHA